MQYSEDLIMDCEMSTNEYTSWNDIRVAFCTVLFHSNLLTRADEENSAADLFCVF
jgi:hypothetical protein